MNPLIDWAKCMVNIPNHMDRTPDCNWMNEIVQGTTTTAPTHANLFPREFIREKPIYPDENFVNFLQRESVTPVINKFKKVDGKFTAVKVCKTAITTELTKEASTSEVKLPDQYQEYSLVFLEEEAHRFPPSRPYDHTINFNDSFVLKVGKVYPLTPKEQKATEKKIFTSAKHEFRM